MSAMPEQPWYDRLLVVLPEAYRAGVFILSIVVLVIFLFVRLGYGFDWDTTLTSFYFGFPCSLALITGGIVFLVRRRNLRHRYSFLDAGFILSGIVLGCFGLRDYIEFRYQGDYKFFKNVWKTYEPSQSFLEPMRGDDRKYVEVKAYMGQIEPISDRPGGNLHLVVSIRDNEAKEGASACHIIRSRLEFPGSGPLGPSTTQWSGSRFEDSDAHEWSLSNLRKNMKCILRVAYGKTAKAECNLLLQVKEE
jgi:hypothetical protein